VRGASLPSPIDFTRRPYNTGHTTVWPCDQEKSIDYVQAAQYVMENFHWWLVWWCWVVIYNFHLDSSWQDIPI